MFVTLKKWMARINELLDRYVLPWPVRFLTFRFVILVTMGLLIPLLVFAKNTVLVLGINSYLNTMSVAVSSIVLLYATIAEIRQKQIAEMQEKRAQEDHLHVIKIHSLIIQALQNQRAEIAELKQILSAMANQEVSQAGVQTLPDLQSLHPRGIERFASDDLTRRWRGGMHHNSLISTIRNGMVSRVEEKKNRS